MQFERLCCLYRNNGKYCEKIQLILSDNLPNNIHGHHIYKDIWTPKLNKILRAKHDTWREAEEFDDHAIRIYNSDEILVGHASVKLSL